MRSRWVTVAGLFLLTLLAWLYMLSGAGMGSMPGMAPSWTLIFTMWSVMMVAMMLPSAAPAILLYAKVHRHSARSEVAPPTTAFLTGYLMCWLVFSGLAATLQLALGSDTLSGRSAAGALLIGAGLYQLSPIKDVCLSRCRSPAEFLTRHYRAGGWGALRLGLLHGVLCVGCCWLLMALLFVGGVMNLAWVAALTLLVAAEKLLPGGEWIARIAGVASLTWGATLLVT